MEKKCYKCGSSNIAKVVSASSASIPEIKKDIEEGRSVASCCCAGTGSGGVYRCRDCNFEWDYYYEIGVQQQEKTPASSDEARTKEDSRKKKWWKMK